ncbi:MAG: DUF3817 domain-containing protein [Nocardioides sp.]|nr:DUF3817 domain-containing protein [Nocardioides sp.]
MTEQDTLSPLRRTGPFWLFTRLATLEAITWALLLVGMFVKYGTGAVHQGELGVRIAGMLHGVVFIAYCLVAVLTWVDQKWTPGRLVVALISAVVPFMTLWFETRVAKDGFVTPTHWRLREEEPVNGLERIVAWLLRNPLLGVLVFLVTLVALTALALTVGPPGK